MKLKEAISFDTKEYEKAVKDYCTNPRNLESIARTIMAYDSFEKKDDSGRSKWKQMCTEIGIGIAAYVSAGLREK